MNSPSALVDPEATPTSLTASPVSSSSGSDLSPASAASIAIFLSLFGLAALAFVIRWTRRRQITSKISDERPLEKATINDVEALAAIRPIVPVNPLPDVRWTPQIRSISGPTLDRSSDKKSVVLPPKRARSPPPSKSQTMFPDPHAKSAPPQRMSFPQNEARSAKSLRGDLSPPVTPQALAVSSMQTRSLGRYGVRPEFVV